MLLQHTRVRFYIFLAFVALSVFIFRILSISSHISHANNGSHKCSNNVERTRCFDEPLNRLDQYCSYDVVQGEDGSVTFSQHEGWTLAFLAITIRHGDRSPIHSLPGSNHKKIDNSIVKLLDNDAAKFAKRLSSFELQLLDSGDKSSTHGESLDQTLNPLRAFKVSDLELSQGQLTSIGFMQHVRIGEILLGAYKDFLGRITSSKQLYIRSTNYVRTIQSVAGLVSSLLPHLVVDGTSSSKEVIPIRYYRNEQSEVMHGVGTHSSSHTVTHGVGEAYYEGSCLKSNSLAKQQANRFLPDKDVMDGLVSKFGHNVTFKNIAELVDSSLPNLCHRIPLPCSTSSCLLRSELEKMMSEADRFYCERYSGSFGGKNSSNLSLYPFMMEILRHLNKATKYSVFDSTSISSKNEDREQIAVFSGHDTVIAPVLSALGVFSKDHPQLCKWPQYASRIVFELYERKRYRMNNMRRRRNSEVRIEYGVRVVYNGLDVTTFIPTCGEEMMKTSSEVCSLAALNHQIEKIIFPYANFNAACAN